MLLKGLIETDGARNSNCGAEEGRLIKKYMPRFNDDKK